MLNLLLNVPEIKISCITIQTELKKKKKEAILA